MGTLATLPRARREPAPAPADPMAYVRVAATARTAYDAILTELSRVRPTMAGSYTLEGKLTDAAEHFDAIASLARLAAQEIRRAR